MSEVIRENGKTRLVLAHAESYLALLQECESCGGDGDHWGHINFCPSCSGRGQVVSDQAVKAGGLELKTALEYEYPTLQFAPYGMEGLESIARKVLAAAIFGEEEE